jgi:nucleotide-binding universal stress UspA family protein
MAMTYKKILVPFDNSSYSEKALNLAIRLAKDFNAQLFILNVVAEIPSSVRMERNRIRSAVTGEMVGMREYVKELYQQMRREVMRVLERKRERAEKSNIAVRTSVVVGYPSDKIIECIKDEGVDLVVMGTRGLAGVSRLAGFGSVARNVSENSPCPVILIH